MRGSPCCLAVRSFDRSWAGVRGDVKADFIRLGLTSGFSFNDKMDGQLHHTRRQCIRRHTSAHILAHLNDPIGRTPRFRCGSASRPWRRRSACHGGLLGVRLEERPARLLRHPEHVLGAVLVRVLGGGRVLSEQRLAPGFEGVRDVLEKDQPDRDVFVVRRLQVLPQLVGREEHLRLEPEVGPFDDGFAPFNGGAADAPVSAFFLGRPRGI